MKYRDADGRLNDDSVNGPRRFEAREDTKPGRAQAEPTAPASTAKKDAATVAGCLVLAGMMAVCPLVGMGIGFGAGGWGGLLLGLGLGIAVPVGVMVACIVVAGAKRKT